MAVLEKMVEFEVRRCNGDVTERNYVERKTGFETNQWNGRGEASHQ